VKNRKPVTGSLEEYELSFGIWRIATAVIMQSSPNQLDMAPEYLDGSAKRRFK
jgi:hypothetical protein